MSVVDLNCSNSLASSLFDSDGIIRWRYPGLPPRKQKVEVEIHRLRKLMEQTVMDGHAFTSEMVVSISVKLDHKLNEYMRLRGEHI